MNNNLQSRFELQGALQQWIDSTMKNYGYSAAEMEDAITHALLKLKNQVLQDYLIEQQRAYEEALASSQEDREEDVNGEFGELD